MRILFALSYYTPHLSGLTNYARRLAEGLAGQGHGVTVLTTRHHDDLPPEETRCGVRVVRTPVLARIGKGIFVRGYRQRARHLAHKHDVMVVNLPISPPEASALLEASREAGIPIVAVYHCDLVLPGSFLNAIARRWTDAATRRVVAAAKRIAVLSMGYAETSPLLRDHLSKCRVVPPPIDLQPASREEREAWRSRQAPPGAVVVGLPVRIAAEKGIEHLLKARGCLQRALGDVRILVTGERREALGERAYFRAIEPLLEDWGKGIAFLGNLSDHELAAFFGACDVTVLPSVNRTESYGLVQVESMLCGTPVVATDMPGVQDPVLRCGSGILVPPGDGEALAAAIVEAVATRETLRRTPEQVRDAFGLGSWLEAWQQLLVELDPPDHGLPSEEQETDGLERFMELHVREIPPFRALVRAVESFLIQRHAPPSEAVLDLGCGDGLFAALTLPTPLACGIDPDPGALAHAARSGAYRTLLHGPANALRVGAGTFSLVLANSVLEHIPELEPVLAEVHRVLAKDGCFLITAPSRRFLDGLGLAVVLDRLGLRGLAGRYRSWFNRRSRHFHLYDAEDWRERLGRAGFRVTHHAYYLSRSAMFWFDLMHYVSLPCLLSRRWTGRWHVLGAPLFASLWTRGLLRLARRPLREDGAYVFLVARKD